MIIKKIIFKRQNKSSFKNLSNYILDEDNNHAKVLADYVLDTKNDMDKVEAYHFTNCSFDNNKDNIKEIITTQQLNTTTKQDKTMHLVVSFKEDERPNIKTLYAIEDEIAEALGMKDHQRLSSVHSNTNNLHIHIAINKINPNTLKVINPYNDVKILQELAIKLEKKYNLQIDNHISSNNVKEKKYNKHTMTCNFENWVKEKITNTIDIMLRDEKTTFDDLKVFLAKHDLEFRERRKGFVISSKTEKLFCKASSIHRNLSKQSLEKRYGQLDLSALKENLQEISVSEKYNKFNGMPPNPLYQNYLNYEKQKLELREKELRMLKLKRNEFK
ncbi:TraI/MobA(P) family conjugative relaxase, partial [Campylobacter fetus]|uniref:TraI/MobA(P) family conjugative relaxase n=1 Tax=Campylobacter fetus TaxID=196 RepID=UPI00190E535D